ncbi:MULTISPECIES: lipoprotein [Legionella]|nr:lipoprotein [Legionella maceachernii]
MRLFAFILIICISVGILSACGQKGPLYLPENKKAHQSKLPKAMRY